MGVQNVRRVRYGVVRNGKYSAIVVQSVQAGEQSVKPVINWRITSAGGGGVSASGGALVE